jgi:hypothetical protein
MVVVTLEFAYLCYLTHSNESSFSWKSSWMKLAQRYSKIAQFSVVVVWGVHGEIDGFTARCSAVGTGLVMH